MNDATNTLFDVNFAKEQTLHNDNLLLELLEQFLLDNQSITTEIVEKSQEGPEALHFVLHRLKGVASNLGCMMLFRNLQVHCQTLTNGTALTEQDINSVTQLISQTFEAIAQYMQSNQQQPQVEEATLEDPVSFLTTLKSNLEDNAFISSEELQNLSALENIETIKDLVQQLITSVEHLEYEEAAALTDKLLKEKF